MSDSLEYADITSESRGVLTPGRIKLTEQNIVFKNSKTGKVEQIAADDIELINSQKFVGNWGLRVFTKNGALHRFMGFKDSDHEKLGKFIKKTYSQDMVEKEMCVKGWNWGTARFMGSVLSFDKDTKTIFEMPLSHVSQCMTGKNEVTLEFHQSDDAPVGLLEMRFHIPSIESAEDDPVESFQNNVMSKASVISASGESIAIFREIHCLTPRGRYDIKVFSTFFQLHGKTFDYKIPMDSVLRLFLLPHKDNRQMFFVLSLDPPIKQGQTRYHFLVLLFGTDEETSMELPFSEEELKEKYDNKLEKELSGPLYEVVGKVMKVLIGRKITGPGNFIGHSGTAAIGCSFKAAAGYLYPLERGFIYIHKPPIHIRFEEIASVNFARSGGSTRSFDFEITLKNGTVHIFSSIEKEEYAKLFDFIQQKKLHVSNMGKDKGGYKDVDFGDSDNENEPDAYLARVKAEAREKESDDDDEGSEEESTDEDFKPNENESDVAEEYDSNVQSDSDDSDASGASGPGSAGEKSKKPKHKKEKKDKKEKKERKERTRKNTKKKDSNRPKRPTTAFMLWLNDTREQIKKDNPGITVTEIAKKGGEMWKELKDKTKWDEKVAKDRQRYVDEMKDYKPAANDSDDEGAGASKAAASKKRKKESPTKKVANSSGSGFISKEYISDDDSSSPNETPKKKDKKNESGDSEPLKEKIKSTNKNKSATPKSAKKKSASNDDESEASGTDKEKSKSPDNSKSATPKKVKKKSASDDDESEASETEKEKSKSTIKNKSAGPKSAKKKSASDDDESEASETEKEKSKSTIKNKSAGPKSAKKKSASDDESEASETEKEKSKSPDKSKSDTPKTTKKKSDSNDDESEASETEKEKSKSTIKNKRAGPKSAKKKSASDDESEASEPEKEKSKSPDKSKSDTPKKNEKKSASNDDESETSETEMEKSKSPNKNKSATPKNSKKKSASDDEESEASASGEDEEIGEDEEASD